MYVFQVVLPTFILERRSLLEMYADFFAHPDLFVRYLMKTVFSYFFLINCHLLVFYLFRIDGHTLHTFLGEAALTVVLILETSLFT